MQAFEISLKYGQTSPLIRPTETACAATNAVFTRAARSQNRSSVWAFCLFLHVDHHEPFFTFIQEITAQTPTSRIPLIPIPMPIFYDNSHGRNPYSQYRHRRYSPALDNIPEDRVYSPYPRYQMSEPRSYDGRAHRPQAARNRQGQYSSGWCRDCRC